MTGYEAAAVIAGASIGAKALYLLFVWLISGAAASWMSERKGYGERAGLTLGLLLSAVGLLVVMLLPGRPGSKWRVRRVAAAMAPPALRPWPGGTSGRRRGSVTEGGGGFVADPGPQRDCALEFGAADE